MLTGIRSGGRDCVSERWGHAGECSRGRSSRRVWRRSRACGRTWGCACVGRGLSVRLRCLDLSGQRRATGRFERRDLGRAFGRLIRSTCEREWMGKRKQFPLLGHFFFFCRSITKTNVSL